MNNKKLLFIGAILSCTQIYAQEAILTCGGNASGSSGNTSYSVGQVVYATNTGSTGTVAQGVQQPFEIQIILGIDNPNINLQLAVFPNPTADLLYLLVKEYNFETLRYQLFDIKGRLLVKSQITAASTTIQMAQYPPAVYLLKVFENNKEVKTFKIMNTK